jgi:hypothetical protein
MHRILIGPDIVQVKYGIRPDSGDQKRPDYPAGYPVHPYKILFKRVYYLNVDVDSLPFQVSNLQYQSCFLKLTWHTPSNYVSQVLKL